MPGRDDAPVLLEVHAVLCRGGLAGWSGRDGRHVDQDTMAVKSDVKVREQWTCMTFMIAERDQDHLAQLRRGSTDRTGTHRACWVRR